jgi:hypothetical protein
MVPIENGKELTDLLAAWEDTRQRTRAAFMRLKDHLAAKDHLNLSFIPRPGVTYSLRAQHTEQRQRDLFAMVDVIDDDPQDRWLSVCFYGEMISDPEEIGDYVPQGLLGEDAVCFDIEAWEDDLLAYVEKRLDEACRFAGQSQV